MAATPAPDVDPDRHAQIVRIITEICEMSPHGEGLLALEAVIAGTIFAMVQDESQGASLLLVVNGAATRLASLQATKATHDAAQARPH